MEKELERMNTELKQLPSQKATPAVPKKQNTKRILISLNKQWRQRWEKLRKKEQEVRSQGGTPQEMFLPGKNDRQKTERKWEIERKSWASMHMKEIE